ncbi:hypothetical protein P171DRAFT_519446 [Karstenula rhodostoma CBS 690.94]|uniref:Uncharacterized protein n=1 Tax=Karstenula rhodostoma CBS 690.94 TaxID=1392251 RepID=A0A9P4UF54_9PLEO|nr:hypothetical protein P171DRAFT_519446 [Karstenula rhodostoma CBS 690.94]
MAAPQTVQTVRRWILTGAVAAITITGALYGADLKSSYEKTQARNRIATVSVDEKIAQHQSLIEDWERTKNELNRKLENFEAKKKVLIMNLTWSSSGPAARPTFRSSMGVRNTSLTFQGTIRARHLSQQRVARTGRRSAGKGLEEDFKLGTLCLVGPPSHGAQRAD